MRIKPWQGIVLPALIVLGIPTYAAIDGQLGSSSTASINISLTILPKIQIKQLEDFRLVATEDANPASIQQINMGCVVTNTQSGYYTLSASSSQGQTADGYYQMQNDKGASINYSLSASNMDGNFQSITSQAVKLKADSSNNDCANGKNLQVKVQLAKNAQLKPGQYGDVVQLQVVPV